MKKSTLIINEAKVSLRLTFPLLLSEWLYAVNFFVATWLAAKLGKESLAAIALVQSIFFFLLMMISGVSAATAILVSQDLGAKNDQGIQQAFVQSCLLNLILVLMAGLILWNIPYFLPLLGVADRALIPLVRIALHAYLWSLVPFAFLMMVEKFLIGLHRTRLVLFLTSLTIPLCIFTNYAFVLGKFGFPRYGIAGFGHGYAVAYGFLGFLFVGISFFDPLLRRFRLYSGFKKISSGSKYFFETWRIGWPLGAMFSIEVGAFLVFTFFMSFFGTDVLAAFQISRQYLVFALTTLFALTESAAVRVGHAVGENNPSLVKRCFYVNIGVALAFMFFLSGIYISAKSALVALDVSLLNSENARLILHAHHFMIAIAILVLFDGIRNVAAGGLRGLKDTKSNMYSSIMGYWLIGLPLAYLFGKVFSLGGEGLWIGFITGVAASALFLLIRFQKLFQKTDLTSLLI